MDDMALQRLLKGIEVGVRREFRPAPVWEWVHQEMKKKGVTLQLLWQEYRESHPDGYQISQFYKLCKQWKKKIDVTLRQEHKAGEKLFVDYGSCQWF